MSGDVSKGLATEVVSSIPVEFETEEPMRGLAVGRLKSKESEIASLVEKSRELIDPRAVYTFLRVAGVQGDTVRLESGHLFTSLVLADVLECRQEIVPYVVTIGPKLEGEALRLGRDNVFQSWALEKIGDFVIQKAANFVKRSIEEKIGDAVSSFSPGTGTGKLFSIEQQKVLFDILDPFSTIGVQLTSSYLMMPRKSISGVLATTKKEYVACQHCPRERCENRKDTFLGEYVPVKCELADL